MATSTYKTFLMKKGSGDSYEKLCDIKDFPDLGGEPEALDTTTLSDSMETHIPGIQKLDALTFTSNYDLTEYKSLAALKDTELELAVWFGGTESNDTVTPTGSEGKFEFKGKLSVYVNGGGVNEVRGMTITVTPSTPITQSAS